MNKSIEQQVEETKARLAQKYHEWFSSLDREPHPHEIEGWWLNHVAEALEERDPIIREDEKNGAIIVMHQFMAEKGEDYPLGKYLDMQLALAAPLEEPTARVHGSSIETLKDK